MKHWKFKGLLQAEGWLIPAFLGINEQGKIQYISQEKPPNITITETVNGYLMPGFQNAHSHAFQYAMAGMTERHVHKDDFWSWREKMYELALSITPDQLEAIATMLYSELLRHGYTHIAEFHYLHHAKDGKPYQNLATMGERLVAAAANTGMNITLIPIFYQKGGFGKPASAEQRRFLSKDVDAYLKLWEASEIATNQYHGANIGLGFHSLRGVETRDILRTLQEAPQNLPIHIHVSEQQKEVHDSVEYLGQGPVEWLLKNISLSSSWQLVHATHLNDFEVSGIVQSGAQVVICPSTEGNLGDGRFRLKDFQETGGKWCIGTDSHIGLSPMEELRILDYGQRIHTHQRNIFHSSSQPDSGTYGFHQALLAGRKAMGNQQIAYFRIGRSLDGIILDANAPLIQICNEKDLLSTFIYAGDNSYLLGTITDGQWRVKAQSHIQEEAIRKQFWSTLARLRGISHR